MRGGLGLPRELGLRELERFPLADFLRIDDLRAPTPGAPAIRFALFHPFLDARFGVNQAFSRISHLSRIQDGRRRTEDRKTRKREERKFAQNSKRGETRGRIRS